VRRLALIAALLLLPAALWAQRSLAIKQFDADIIVRQDGTLDVTERITVAFQGKWNGVYRTVPVKYRNPQGFSWRIRLDEAGATDAATGASLKVERERQGADLKFKVWVPGAEDVTRTVVFRYRVANGLRFFDDHDELYWNVTGDQWDVPIEAARARIELPAAVSGVRAIAYNGPYGARSQDASVAIEGNVVRIAMPASLGFHEGLTAVVGWDKGAVREPTASEQAGGFLASNWPLLLPLVVLLGMWWRWRRVGRDPEARPVAPRYEPEGGLTPAEAGTLLDESVDMRDITATIVDLAVRGHLRIEERDTPKLLGLLSSTEYIFHRLAPPAGAAPLQPHEQALLFGIFQSDRQEVPLSELENEFYQHLPGIRSGVYNRLVERGYYRARPDQVKGRWTVLGVLMAIVITGGGIVAAARLGMTPLPFLVGGVLSAIIVAAFGQVMPARTVAGARAYEASRGFEEFLRRVESDRFARVIKTPEMFERFLPYAMAFGVEKKWAHAFADIVREPPTWYVGAHPAGFSPSGFTSRLGALTNQVGSTMSSSPRSSGGSGFGGGGSSGGGGGGGGGGGF